MNRLVMCLMVLSIVLFYSPAYAQTPDGETPANEGVCDELLGGTPGLYGLCVAYCEAQDLNEVDFNDPASLLKAVPNRKILENYRKKIQPGDPDMPCVQPPPSCPCWTEEMIARTNDPNTSGQCIVNDSQTAVVDFDGFGGTALFLLLEFGETTICGFQINNNHVLFEEPSFGAVITAEEGEDCRESVLAAAANAGYICE